MKVLLSSLPFLLLAGCASLAPPAARVAPLVDHHQHLVSAAFAPLAKMQERDGAALVRELDAAGVDRAVVLSMGYTYGDERKGLSDPDRRTREENDWTSAQVTANAPRLIGFCSASPLRPAALQELERCLRLPGMAGIKLHLGNSGVSLRNPAHVLRMQQLFALAQGLRAPVLAHMRARGGSDYGALDARLFLDKIVPVAPSIEIVIAHLGASSPGYRDQNDEVMGVFADAAQRKDRRMRNLYFDVAANVSEQVSATDGALIVQRMRQIGVNRFVYGSDLSVPGGTVTRGWEIFRTKVPLTQAELQQIMNNRASFAS